LGMTGAVYDTIQSRSFTCHRGRTRHRKNDRGSPAFSRAP
jgi:hypothetical protein